MVEWVTAVKIANVCIAGLVALVPLLYPNHSFFTKEAQKGVKALQNWDTEQRVDDNGMAKIQRISILEPDDTGFRQLERVIRENTSVRHQITQIQLIHEDPEGGGISFGSGGTRRIEQAQLQAVDTNDDVHVLSTHPYDIERVLELEDLKQWVDNIAVRRSHYWATALVLIWSSLSVTLIF